MTFHIISHSKRSKLERISIDLHNYSIPIESFIQYSRLNSLGMSHECFLLRDKIRIRANWMCDTEKDWSMIIVTFYVSSHHPHPLYYLQILYRLVHERMRKEFHSKSACFAYYPKVQTWLPLLVSEQFTSSKDLLVTIESNILTLQVELCTALARNIVWNKSSRFLRLSLGLPLLMTSWVNATPDQTNTIVFSPNRSHWMIWKPSHRYTLTV
jgi:hypothetical protein